MINKTRITTLLCSLLFLCSCEDWLNVKPSNETIASDLFSSERGFQEALSGAYTLMTVPELYGREMTFGLIDVIAQQYSSFQTGSPYVYAQYYDYKQSESITLCDGIWSKQFTVIANINDLLSFIDSRKSVFATEGTYSIIKGEALALRAFLHFDLLKLYVPRDADGTSAVKIMPYVEEYSKNTSESLTFKEVSDRIIRDLSAAAELLKSDPILTGNKPTDIYFKNRNYHMNYYAVRAVMARVYHYLGNTTEALRNATEVIDAQKNRGLFPFVEPADVTNSDRNRIDRTFSSEHIFALNIRDLQEYTTGYTYKVSQATLMLPSQDPEMIYEGFSDYRRQFFERESGIDNVPSKFWQLDPDKKFIDKMPMIRISEMYYIAAECKGSVDDLNTVRRARSIVSDLPSGLAPELLEAEILKEYNKEFVGEGQVFYYHKRKGTPTLGWGYAPIYELPMPEKEINFGGRPRPEKPDNNL